ncbi:hypothetical protein FDP41_003820 [Naegleria fowleri]|uniref:AB hydrolase-1 domain-containing protein n=1 Tax=Naegleria fowleri TaxID=5763 RepID=A0A6A5BJJ2_NAEFO|nr:uncharacterized protein FDP41_003820 [Naegleria fowleri]KAF0977167.1 hypothetical protein FDP41_003820 [Naegleria fowleri]CAG4709723.1 unnamed protein product [Naegleria fowleri]
MSITTIQNPPRSPPHYNLHHQTDLPSDEEGGSDVSRSMIMAALEQHAGGFENERQVSNPKHPQHYLLLHEDENDDKNLFNNMDNNNHMNNYDIATSASTDASSLRGVKLFLSNDGSIVGARRQIVSVSERVAQWLRSIKRSSNQIRFHLQFNASLTLGQVLKYGIPLTTVLIYCIYKLISYVKYHYFRDKSKDISNPNNKYRISLKKLWRRNSRSPSQDYLAESEDEKNDTKSSTNLAFDDSKSVQTTSDILLPPSPNYLLSERNINGVKGVMLPSGRWLSYEEYGNTSSRTRVIFFFHSIGQSRLEIPCNEHDSIAKQFNVRFIHVDRPGYGQSSQQKARSFLSFAKDIAQLSNILEIEQYSVMGVSTGSCYAYACAYLNIDNKVVSCNILSGELPYSLLPHAQLSRFLKDVFLLVNYVPLPIFKMLLKIVASGTIFNEPEKFTTYIRQSGYYSKENIEDLQNFCTNCVLSLREGMNAYGITEVLRELKMEREDWGFSLKDITIPVHVWHGENSQIIPLNLLKSAIPSLISDRYTEHKITDIKLSAKQKLSRKSEKERSSNSAYSSTLTRVGSSDTIETMTTSVTIDTRKTPEDNNSNLNYRYTNVNLHTVSDRGHFFWRNAMIFAEIVKTVSEHIENIYDLQNDYSYLSETTSLFEFRTDF